MSTKFIEKISNKEFILLSLTGIFLLYLIQSWQGFDMCDEGWVLTGYQQIFNDPTSVEYLFLYYSTQILGGIWYSLFGVGGIISFRILSVFVLTLSFYAVYCLLKKQISRSDFLISFVLIYFSWNSGLLVFHHNYLTILLYCTICLFLYRALVNTDWKYMLIAGFFLGIEIFARIPNLSLLALIILLFPFSLKHSFKTGFQYLVLFLSGIIIGCGMILLTMKISNHIEIFERSAFSGFSAVGSSESTHNLSGMLYVYIGNYYGIAKAMAMLFIPSFIYIQILTKKKITGIARNVSDVIFLIIFCGLTYLSIHRLSTIYNVYAFATGMILYGLFKYRKDIEKIYLLLISFITLYCLPLGSDFGIGNMGSSCIFIAVPVSVFLCRKEIQSLNIAMLKYSIILGGLIFIVIGAKNILSQCYFDKGWRWAKIYRINSPLATTYTTIQNKTIVDNLLTELDKYIKKNDRVLFFQNTPMLHFLTETRPYLGNPWPWTYDPENLQRHLNYSHHINPVLPVIVRDKGTVGKWQYQYEDWDNSNSTESYSHKNGRILAINEFIQGNGYSVVWENDLFQILLPPNTVNN